MNLYVDGPEAANNNGVFDSLAASRAGVEDAFGAELRWQPVHEKRPHRPNVTIPAGLAEERVWSGAVEKACDTVDRPPEALVSRLEALYE